MNQRTITLPADLVERFEQLADQRGRSPDELFAELLTITCQHPAAIGR